MAGRSGQAAVEVDSLPLQLPGIDLAAGLRQVHGNRALYRRLLIHFYDEWHSSASSLSATLNAGQAPALHAVHSLKGVSATLGAGQLSDAAAQVETVLRDGKMVAAEDLQRLTANLAEVLDGIGGWVGTAGAGSQMVGGARQLADPAAVDRLLARIGELVAEGDLEANERIGELLSMVEGSPCSAAAAELASLIERFEFDESMVRVEALRAAVAGLASQGTGRE
jgi:two-component system sensor histidine kinase/response regulator